MTISHRDMDSAIEAKLESWASKVYHEVGMVRDQNRALEEVVSSLTRHIASLETAIDHISDTQQGQQKRFEVDLKKLDNKFTSHMNNIESFCGFTNPLGNEIELYISPEFKICNRLDTMEKNLGKVYKDMQRYEKRSDTEKRYHQHASSSRDSRQDQLAFYPSPRKSPDTHSRGQQSPRGNTSYRGRDRDRGGTPSRASTPTSRSRSPRGGAAAISPAKPSTRNPYGSGVYTPPRKTSLHINHPSASGGPRPPSTSSPNPPLFSRPFSAPTGTGCSNNSHSLPSGRFIIAQEPSQPTDKSSAFLKKTIDEIYHHIGQIDAKNDKQNMFLLNELMDNFQLHDEKNQASLGELERGLQATVRDLAQRLHGVQVQVADMEVQVKKSLQTKFRQIDQNIQAIKQEPASGEKDKMNTKSEVEAMIQESIQAETLKTKLSRENFMSEQAALYKEFAQKESALKSQIEEEKRKIEKMHKKFQTDQELYEEKIQEVEADFQEQLNEEARKNAKKLAKIQKKFDKFIENQIEVRDNLQKEKEMAAAAAATSQQLQLRKEGSATCEQLDANTLLNSEEKSFIQLEKNALLSVFAKTGGAQWHDTFLWSSHVDVKSWLAVDVDPSDGRVTGLQLGSNHLTGAIPHELAQLQKLTELQLFGNCLSGSIPSCLGQLTNLQSLLLSQNKLTGEIPWALSKCVLLDEIDFSDNELSGVIPDCLAIATLTSLSLQNNKLEGPLPRSLTRLHLLQHFTSDLLPFPAEKNDDFYKVYDYINAHAIDNNNHLDTDGSINLDVYNANILEEQDNLLTVIQDFGGDASQLQWTPSTTPVDWHGVSFDRQGCVCSLQLTAQQPPLQLRAGVFPESLEYLSNVLFLDLSYNLLDGSLPREVLSLVHLQFLYLDHNQLQGEIRPDIGKLGSLRTLNLSHNQLTGHLKQSISELHHLEILCLSNNNLDGVIPEELCTLSKLRVFDVSSNNLTGSVPERIGTLQFLQKLDVSCNQLEGLLPASVGHLSALQRLDFSFNAHMSAALPASLTQLTRLTELNIQMTGEGDEGANNYKKKNTNANNILDLETDTDTGGSATSKVEAKRNTILKRLPSLKNVSL